MVWRYQNEIAPIFYYGISTKTNEKDLEIPKLQPPDWKSPCWMTLYIIPNLRLGWCVWPEVGGNICKYHDHVDNCHFEDNVCIHSDVLELFHFTASKLLPLSWPTGWWMCSVAIMKHSFGNCSNIHLSFWSVSQGKVQVYGEVIDCRPVKTETYLIMETLCLTHLVFWSMHFIIYKYNSLFCTILSLPAWGNRQF